MAALTAAIVGLAAATTAHAFMQKPAKMPQLPTMPAAPADTRTADASASQAAATQARKRAASSPGRRSTLLTGPAGLTSEAPATRKTLLGQ